MSISISIVVPTFNRRDLLACTLATVFRQNYPADQYEVLVAVDGSADGTVEMLSALKPAAHLRVLAGPHGGQGSARNAGAFAARGRIILFLDDDLLCDPDLLREHAEAHRSDERVVVIGRMHPMNEGPPSMAAEWMRETLDDYFAPLEAGAPLTYPRNACVGPNCSIPRTVFVDAGGYAEAPGFEDCELGLRLWESGIRFRFRPQARTFHLYRKSNAQVLMGDAPRDGRRIAAQGARHGRWRRHSALAAIVNGSPMKRILVRLAAATPAGDALMLGLVSTAERLAKGRRGRTRASWAFRTCVGLQMLRGARAELGSWRAVRESVGHQLPVLLYHRVNPDASGPHPELVVSPEQFAGHMSWLAARGYRGIRPSDWRKWRDGSAALEGKPVLITFDDAYADVAEYGLPVLRRHGFSAGVFVITGNAGGRSPWDGAATMTVDQIRHWAEQGIEFGGHSRSHRDLTALDEGEMRDEILGCRDDLLQWRLASDIGSFAYPYGAYDDTSAVLAAHAFDLAFTCDERLNNLTTDPCRMGRTMVQPGDSLVDLAFRVRLGWSPWQRARARLRPRARWRRLRAAAARVRDADAS